MTQRSMLGGLLLLVLASTANAGLIEISYTGEVSSVDAELAGTFSSTDAVAGTVVFDTATPGGSGTPTSSNYSAITSFELSIGGYTGSANSGTVTVYDDDTTFGDSTGFQSAGGLSGDLVNGLALSRLQLFLNTNTELGTLLDQSLPSVADLDALWSVNIAAGNINFMQFQTSKEVRYRLTTLSARLLPTVGVAEPATTSLLLLGALLGTALAAPRRR